MNDVQLLLTRSPLWQCPLCHQDLSHHEIALEVRFEDALVTLGVNASYCTIDRVWLVDFVLAEEVLDEEGFSLIDAEGFSVNAERMSAAVWLGETIGVIPWEVHQQAVAATDNLQAQRPPHLEDIRHLPQVNERWFIAQAPGAYYLEEGKTTLSHVGLLVTEQQFIRGMLMHDDVLGSVELINLIVLGCAKPPPDLPARQPRLILVDNPMVAEQLTQKFKAKGIALIVQSGDVSPAQEALTSLKEALDPDPVPSYFIHHPEHEVKAFFKAARGFFRSRPWEVIDGSKFLAFQLEDGVWRYANVMGQAGEAFGIASFRNWLEVCKATNNPETLMDVLAAVSSGDESLPKSLLATGGAESMTLSPLEALAPEDAAYLKKLKVKPSWRKGYATVHRYTPYGMETPLLEITTYTTLMTVLTERTNTLRGKQITSLKTTVETPKGRLSIRYPAKGDEGATAQDYYQFDVPFRLGAMSETPGEIVRVEVKAPGEAKWHRVIAALTKEAKSIPGIFPWVVGVWQGEYALWLDQAPVKEPSPTVEQLAKQQGLALKMGLDEQPPLEFLALPRPAKAEIHVRFRTQQSDTAEPQERR